MGKWTGENEPHPARNDSASVDEVIAGVQKDGGARHGGSCDVVLRRSSRTCTGKLGTACHLTSSAAFRQPGSARRRQLTFAPGREVRTPVSGCA